MDGILIVDKPKEYTSHDVVAKVKKICHTKVGHTGTLDPMATGVLPLLLGQGTKLSQYLINHDKIYEALVELGKQTDTADSEGNIIQEKEVDLSKLEIQNIQEILQSLVGKQSQTPPIYSAIKVNGKKLYEYARNNQQVEIPTREIEIYEIELLEINKQEKTILFRVHCSKGTYIRTLCETIAQKLETVGYMKELRRIKVGSFCLNQAVSIKEIQENQNNPEFWKNNFITIQDFFKNKPSIILEENKLALFLNGALLNEKKEDGLYQIINENGSWIGIGEIEKNKLRRKLII